MNQKIDLEFVDRPTFSVSQFNLLAVLLCLIGVALAVYVFKEYQLANQQFTAVSLQLQQTETQATKNARVKKQHTEEISDAELKKIRETIADLTTPWDALLSALEAIQTPDIALLNLQPNKKKQLLTLTGQAKNIQTMLRYVEAVSSLKMLSNAYLQNHVVDTNDSNKPVNFTIVAKWK